MSSTSAITPTEYPIPSITSYTNKGSLPTPVTFPPACFTDNLDFQVGGLGLTEYTYYTQGCALSTCCPSGNYYSSAFQWYTEYYSPAVCPSGYQPVAADPIISTASGETVRFCCPSSMINGVVGQQLPSGPSATSEYMNWACQDENPGVTSSTISVYDNVVDQKFVSLRTTDLPYYYQIAYPIQIRWKAEQLQGGTIVVTSSTQSSASTLSSSSATGNPQHNANDLSSGAIAGISVAAVVVALLLIAAGLFLFFRRKKSSRAHSAVGKEALNPDVGYHVDRHSEEPTPGSAEVHELFATPEMDSPLPSYELDTLKRPQEHPGS